MSKNVKVNDIAYSGVSLVQLPTTDGGSAQFKDVDEIVTSSGTVTITENGIHDVTNYAQAVVNVHSSGENDDNAEVFLRAVLEPGKVITEDIHFTVPDGVTAIREGAFAGLTRDGSTGYMYVTLPDTVEEIGSEAFYYNVNCVINALPKNLKTIGREAFRYARSIFKDVDVLKIPGGVETIDLLAFYQYNGNVTTVTFEGTPTSVANNAFQDCSVTTINVPWAEGAVANAPWGATSATINYNYTGE